MCALFELTGDLHLSVLIGLFLMTIQILSLVVKMSP